VCHGGHFQNLIGIEQIAQSRPLVASDRNDNNLMNVRNAR
jgi:hypothetical protein